MKGKKWGPALKIALIDGRVALILVGSLTLPSFNGTLKSTLIKTLFPRK